MQANLVDLVAANQIRSWQSTEQGLAPVATAFNCREYADSIGSRLSEVLKLFQSFRLRSGVQEEYKRLFSMGSLHSSIAEFQYHALPIIKFPFNG
jgi:hypothetical protein